MSLLEIGTASGSTYHVDTERKTWTRVVAGEPDPIAPLRTTWAEYKTWTGASIGQGMVFTGESLTPGGICRVIGTSAVVSVQLLGRA